MIERWAPALIGLMLVPWLLIQAQASIPGDMAWLSLAAGKFLAGAQMTDAFHDSNPPLCYLVYIPVAILTETGLPLWTAGFLYAAGLLAVLTLLLALVLKKGFGFTFADGLPVVAGYLLAVVFYAGAEFGNKDHLIAIGLLPFLLAQICINDRRVLPGPVLWAVLVLATPLVLMKPHYGLLPLCVLAARLWNRRSWRVVLDADVACLALGTALYGVVTWLWFGDYVRDVLLDVGVGLYMPMVSHNVFVTAGAMALLSACLMIFAFFCEGENVKKRLYLWLAVLSLVAVIPFVTQMKGFSLHMIPYLALVLPAALWGIAQTRFFAGKTVVFQTAAMGFILLAGGYGYILCHPALMHDDVRNAALTRYIDAHAGQNGFIMQAETTNIATRVAVYTGKPEATRFPSLWFLSRIGGEARKALRQSYGDMLAGDIARNRPDVIALYHDRAKPDDPLVLFKDNPQFMAAWAPYRQVDTIAINQTEFYRGVKAPFSPYSAYDIFMIKE